MGWAVSSRASEPGFDPSSFSLLFLSSDMNEVVSKRAEYLFINTCMVSAHSDRSKVNLSCAAQGLKKNNQGQKIRGSNFTVTDFFPGSSWTMACPFLGRFSSSFVKNYQSSLLKVKHPGTLFILLILSLFNGDKAEVINALLAYNCLIKLFWSKFNNLICCFVLLMVRYKRIRVNTKKEIQ